MSSWVGVSEIMKSSKLVFTCVFEWNVSWNVDPLKVCQKLELGDSLDLLSDRLSVVMHGEGDLIEGGVELPVFESRVSHSMPSG